MTARTIVVYAIVYTVLMLAAVQFVDVPGRVGIILAIANVWFWIGRMSALPRSAGAQA
ncbi:hypothetical protein [Mesorhizobium sp. 2RAF21]|uniref:hypothetical protein n=1 Tax=Mesorhizobium sp. 2RAF21 TaxID=3232995 RepID=UPI003F94C883